MKTAFCSKYIRFLVLLVAFATLLISCGKENKQVQSNLSGIVDESLNYAKSIYGDKVEIVLTGDLTAESKIDAIALVVKKKIGEGSYWIQKGCVIEKDGDKWGVILYMDEKLKSTKGELIPQENAVNGYLLSFDQFKSPTSFNITMADSTGKPSSDEAVIKWNPKTAAYEMSIAGDNLTP